jgi:prolyl-tRNA synthetase
MSNFVCGANQEGFHLQGVNWVRDLPEPARVEDFRNVTVGDPSPDGKGTLDICRGIEVGQVFQLGTKYSAAMNATFIDEKGESRVMEMGCYGIGVTRIVAAAIEQNHDDRGIRWPAPMAPFQVAIVPLGFGKSAAVRETAEKLYADLIAAGIDALLDDRDERPGVLLADNELIGIPHRVVVGERSLKQGQLEYQSRTDAAAEAIELKDAFAILQQRVCGG